MTEQQPAARDELVLLISSPNTGTGRVHALVVNPNRVPAKFLQHANRTGLKLDEPHANVASFFFLPPPSAPSHIQLRPIQRDRPRTPEPSEQNVKRRGLPRFLGNIPEVQMPARGGEKKKEKSETSWSKFGEKLWAVTSRREIPAAWVSSDVCPCKAAGQRCHRGEPSPPGEHLQLAPAGCKTHNCIILGMPIPLAPPPCQLFKPYKSVGPSDGLDAQN